jgi:hypothetical protein
MFEKFNLTRKVTTSTRENLTLVFFFLVFFSANAATIYVNSATGSDANAGSIGAPYKTFHKAYTMAAASGDVINLTGTFDWTAGDEIGDVSGSGYTISKNITIQGQGAQSTFVKAANTSNTADRRVFSISNGISVSINNLTISNGKTSSGGAIYLGGSTANIIFNSCELINNYSTDNYGGAIYANYGTVTANNSTFSGNNVSAWGAVLYSYYGIFTFTNCTVTSNTGLSIIHTIFGTGVINFTNNTIAYNTINANYTNAVYIETSGYTLNLQNNLIVENKNGTTARDLSTGSSTLNNAKNNVIETTGTGINNGINGNIVGSNIFGLSNSLSLNGSINTKTLSINCLSVAVNAGVSTANGSISVPLTDQRSIARSGNTDIGSFENAGGSEISVSGTLTAFSKCGSSPSSNQSINVLGCNLTNNISISAPTGFEISTNSSTGFGTTLTLTQSGGSVASTIVYIRMSAASSGSISGNLTLTSTGASSLSLPVSGTAAALSVGVVSSNQIICYNSNASDIVLTGSSGTIQWQSSINNSTWTNITSATSATLTAAQIGALTTTKYFRAVVTSGSCSGNSATVKLNVNNGLDFDGSGDFVNIGNHASLNFMGNFTIESWVYVPSSPKYSINTIFSKNYPNNGTPGYTFAFNHWNTTNLLLVLEDGVSAISSNKPVVAGAWNHVAIVVSGNGTIGTFYLNGIEAGSSSMTLTNASAVNEFIGSMDSGGNYSLKGTLDELRIWNVSRTQQELLDNLDNPLVGNETGLVAYYDFNQGVPAGANAGLTVKDQTANVIDGTFTGISLSGSTSNFVDGNHLSVITPESSMCLTATSPKLRYGGTGKTPTSYQWYSNTSAATSGSTLISGSISNTYDAPTSIAATKFYYVNASGTCAASSTSNFAKVITQNASISGGDYLYLGHTGNYTSTAAAAVSNPWVISNTAFATTTNTGVVSAVAAGTPTLTFTSDLGCISTKTINVVPVEWVGTTSTDWTIGSNWNGGYVPTNYVSLSVKANATSDLVLNESKTITTLNFNGANRKVDLGNYTLTATTINGANASNYVKTSGTGKLALTAANNASVAFPIGKSSYNPVTITNKSGASDVFSARVLDAVYLNGTSGSVVSTPVVNRTWDISKTNANAGAGVNFVYNWNAGEVINGSFSAPKMNHHTGSAWEIPTVTSTTFGANMLTVVGYTGTFSPFTVAEGASALPVEMVYFYVNCKETDVQIQWQTASEHNSDYFQLETSLDGLNWDILQTIPAAGFSQELLNYSAIDLDAARKQKYYRLKQVDFNGDFEMYGPLKADCAVESSNISLYPNPCESLVTVSVASQISTEVNYTLISPEGKVLENKKMAVQSGITSITLDVSNYPRGMYILQFYVNEKRFIKKLTVQ